MGAPYGHSGLSSAAPKILRSEVRRGAFITLQPDTGPDRASARSDAASQFQAVFSDLYTQAGARFETPRTRAENWGDTPAGNGRASFGPRRALVCLRACN